MSPIRRTAVVFLLIGLVTLFALRATAQTGPADITQGRETAVSTTPLSNIPCTDGLADGTYPCENVDLLAFMPLSQIGGGEGNDSWGWTDPKTGKEYALMGRTNGIAIVDISDPFNPIYIGNLRSRAGSSAWRDVKVYENYAYVVADALGSHGLQIFDLTHVRDVATPPVTFIEDVVSREIGSAHNIFINEETGYAYVLGAGGGSDRITCSGGLVMFDLKQPLEPAFAGCFSADGYTHDTQCVVYNGPDAAHHGSEICFNANEDTLTIADVSDKAAPVQLARKGHPGAAYVHQGWLTDDQRYFVMDDEIDESRFGHNTRTYVWDVADLENPLFLGHYESDNTSLDHNLYIHNNVIFAANYTSGLRLFEPTNLATKQLTPLGYFDTHPNNDSPTYNGAWSNYPFFASGTVVVSDINRGLFLVRPNFLAAYTLQTAVSPAPPATIGTVVTPTITLTNSGNVSDSYTIALEGNSWESNAPAQVGPLAPGESITIPLSVTIGSGTNDTVSVILTSTGNNAVRRVIELTSTATTASYRLYLPISKHQ